MLTCCDFDAPFFFKTKRYIGQEFDSKQDVISVEYLQGECRGEEGGHGLNGADGGTHTDCVGKLLLTTTPYRAIPTTTLSIAALVFTYPPVLGMTPSTLTIVFFFYIKTFLPPPRGVLQNCKSGTAASGSLSIGTTISRAVPCTS